MTSSIKAKFNNFKQTNENYRQSVLALMYHFKVANFYVKISHS